MGSFSWLKADNLTNVSNVVQEKPFKFLIPQEYGGGFIEDYYQDYGYLAKKENGMPKYDMYELLAFWNCDMPYKDGTVKDYLKYTKSFPQLKEIDKNTDYNRIIGIEIGCYNTQIDKLKFPLKLVSASYKGSYEDCAGKSYGDPSQGFYPRFRNKQYYW